MQRLSQHWLLALAFALCTSSASAAINLNTATKDDLVSLPGIGPAKAQAILDYRGAHGAFKSIEELKDVKGIGAKRFEKLKGELKLTGTSTRPGTAGAEKSGAAPHLAKGEVAVATKREAPPAEKH